jgi:hypothetical protein
MISCTNQIKMNNPKSINSCHNSKDRRVIVGMVGPGWKQPDQQQGRPTHPSHRPEGSQYNLAAAEKKLATKWSDLRAPWRPYHARSGNDRPLTAAARKQQPTIRSTKSSQIVDLKNPAP